jgi:hypothetical protein
MTLNHTVIVPGDDPKLARQLFSAAVNDEDTLLIVVLGDNKDSRRAVQCADRRANVVVEGFGRKVVWIRNREILTKEIKSLKAGLADLSVEHMKEVIAFSLSLDDTVMDIVRMNDSISFIRMESAFLKGGTV